MFYQNKFVWELNNNNNTKRKNSRMVYIIIEKIMHQGVMLVWFKWIIEKSTDLGSYGNTIVEKLNNNIIYLIGLDIENGLMKIFMDKN